jgi:putative ABC transport system permease protein
VERVFGLPAGALATWLAVLLAAAVGTVTVIALRNTVLLKMGLRNIPRRRGRSALIVLGLMLGTAIISAALFTGDTMATAVRSSVFERLGQTDLIVSAGTDTTNEVDVGVGVAYPYFPAEAAVATVDDAARSLPVDGVMGAIVEPVAAQHAAGGRTAPRVTLFAPDLDRAGDFGFAGLPPLDDSQVILDPEAADELAAPAGSDIVVLVGDRLLELEVAAVADLQGTGTDGASLMLPLDRAQELLDHGGEVNQVLVSNTGGERSGVAATPEVETALDQVLTDLDLHALPAKADGLDTADAAGNAFVQLFTTFGTFSMAAGILLIFLIFVMLAAERRPEMGMARAIGTQRTQLVQMFVYEGAAYDLAAAAIGAVLGIAISYVMVQLVARSFTADDGFDVSYSLSGRSVVTAYALGVLLTMVVVTASAWRVSRLNIVSAVRDIPETSEPRHPKARWLLPVLGVLLGALLAYSGAQAEVFMPWMLGVSIMIFSVVPVARYLGRGERLAYTAAGAGLIVLWLLPLDSFDALLGNLAMDFSVWVVCGLVVVVAATWLITYNADVLLGVAARLAAPFQRWRPVAKMAVAYPLKSRFRTGVTMAMFMLVVFTLVTGSTIPTAFNRAFDDVGKFGGGYDVRAMTAPVAAVDDLRAELPPDVADDIEATGAQSFVPVEARQESADRAAAPYPARGVDEAFLDHTTYGLSAMATGYGSAREVWDALAADPGLAVVDQWVAPRRDQWGFAVLPEFQLSGFYLEDRSFEPVPVELVDPVTGEQFDVTVIGVLDDNAPFDMAGITVSQALLAPLGERARPTVHHLALRDGAVPEDVAAEVESSLLALGVEAQSYQEILDDSIGASTMFIQLVQGFMALGLVVGVAALGVITARAVVERRQQIGMLRAIGFQPEMIRRSLLAETSIVALSAIVIGTLLGLAISYNVIADTRTQPGYADIEFAVPWAALAAIMAAVLGAALLTTLVPAHRATKIYPAEALHYQ